MREGSPIQFSTTDPHNGLPPQPKSLFQNILPVSPFDARIYTDALRYKPGKSLRMNTLRTDMKKICASIDDAKIYSTRHVCRPHPVSFYERSHFTL